MTTAFWRGHPPIPGYEPIRVLGQNGAIVYLARSIRLDKPAALQVWWNRPLPPNASMLVDLKHPNILEVFDVGDVDGHSYMAFEYVEAESLAQQLLKGSLSDIEARKCAIAITSALQFAREAGAAVGTVTPGFVLLTEPLKLFLHHAGVSNTRPDFAAPEEDSGTRSDAAADVYRVGALLYAALTTQPPISMRLAQRRRRGVFADYTPAPPRQLNPTVSEELEAICRKCLEVAPVDRYGSLREVAQSLTRSSDTRHHAV